MISSLPVHSLAHLLYGITVSTRLCFLAPTHPLPPDTHSNKMGASSYPSLLLGVLPYFLTSTEIELSLEGTTSSSGF